MGIPEEFRHVRCLSYGLGKVVKRGDDLAVEMNTPGDITINFFEDAARVAYARYKGLPDGGNIREIRGLTEEDIFRRGFDWKPSPISQSERNFAYLSPTLEKAIHDTDELYFAGQKARCELEDKVGREIEIPTWKPLGE